MFSYEYCWFDWGSINVSSMNSHLNRFLYDYIEK